jgi:predicted transcriptional regulator
MEVHLDPEIEKKLKELAAQTGRPADELAEDAIAIYAGELAHVRDTLDRRYDEIKSGKVRMIPGDEAFARLMAKTEAGPKNRSI